jgi:hypothetical protein
MGPSSRKRRKREGERARASRPEMGRWRRRNDGGKAMAQMYRRRLFRRKRWSPGRGRRRSAAVCPLSSIGTVKAPHPAPALSQHPPPPSTLPPPNAPIRPLERSTLDSASSLLTPTPTLILPIRLFPLISITPLLPPPTTRTFDVWRPTHHLYHSPNLPLPSQNRKDVDLPSLPSSNVRPT